MRSRAPSPGHAALNAAFAAVAIASAVLGPIDLAGGLGTLSTPLAVAVGLAVAGLAGAVVAKA